MQPAGKVLFADPRAQGGVLFAVHPVCYVTGIVEFTFDDILKEVRIFFFYSVGFQQTQCSRAAATMLVFLSLVIALILAQNFWRWGCPT